MNQVLTLAIKSFDKELPRNGSEILILNGDKDDISRHHFKTNDGSHDDSTLGMLFSLGTKQEYVCCVYVHDDAFIGWCYPYDFKMTEKE